MIEPKRIEHLQKEEPFSSDQYFKPDILISIADVERKVDSLQKRNQKVVALWYYARLYRGFEIFKKVK